MRSSRTQTASGARKRRTGRETSPKGTVLGIVLLAVFVSAFVLLAPKTPTQTAAANVTGTQTDAGASTGSPDLHITEAMSSNRTAYPDETGSFPDWIELTNEGDSAIQLKDYGLSGTSISTSMGRSFKPPRVMNTGGSEKPENPPRFGSPGVGVL